MPSSVGQRSADECAETSSEDVSIMQREPPARPSDRPAAARRVTLSSGPPLLRWILVHLDSEVVTHSALITHRTEVILLRPEKANPSRVEPCFLGELPPHRSLQRLATLHRARRDLHTRDCQRQLIVGEHEELLRSDDITDNLLCNAAHPRRLQPYHRQSFPTPSIVSALVVGLDLPRAVDSEPQTGLTWLGIDRRHRPGRRGRRRAGAQLSIAATSAAAASSAATSISTSAPSRRYSGRVMNPCCWRSQRPPVSTVPSNTEVQRPSGR